jgi:hypothetical protein
MRLFVIAAIIALAATPAPASPSCMTQSEARQKFPNQHLWWHGPNRCWDATPSRTKLAKRNTTRNARPAEREAQADRDTAPAKVAAEKPAAPEKRPQNGAQDGRWRESMSRMLPGDEQPPVEPQGQVRFGNAANSASPPPVQLPAPMNWHDRWIDISTSKRVATPAPADMAANAEPVVTPTRVMLALLAVVLTIGLVELVFRKTQPDWRR